MATEGNFDTGLKIASWFMDELYDEGWFSRDLIVYPIPPAGGTFTPMVGQVFALVAERGIVG